MLDLRYELPTDLLIGGEHFDIDTDFRVWLNWLENYDQNQWAGVEIFTGKKPKGVEWVQVALDFAINEPATPRAGGSSTGARLVDFILDGEYIVGSFMQAYNIDLTSIEHMHWHLFLALFRSLPSSSKMAQIMGYRGYSRSSSTKRPERIYAEQRDAWSLEHAQDREQNAELLAWADDFFKGVD